ncbi:MAG: amidophosphoribosyltransferase [Gemmatimonadales bacterium]
MCGIFGISGASNAAELAYLGLYALQHRGQESAGIVSIDADGKPHQYRGMGLVPDIFKPKRLVQLHGDIAIGHTRYSTTGSSVLANAQPTVVNYHAGPLALAHNGNLVNGRELRRDLVATGSIFQTSSDTEALVHLIARSDARDPEDQVRDALDRAEGAYTIVMTMGRTMHGIVDPMGFRPLVLGRLGDAWILTSETCALDIVGAEVERELQPGEWVTIEDGKVSDRKRLETAPSRRCVFELIYFSRPDSVVFGESVDRVRRDLGRQLAREHPAPNADSVFSVPDSSNAMALGFADESGLPLEHGLIRNHYVGRTFINPGQASRTSKVRIKFNPVRDVIDGKSVVVVDDSLVRGTTSQGLITMIRHAGAREVHMRIASPPITGPCHYGIDTPTRSELIAASHTVDEISEHLGVDSLGYLSLEGTLRAVGGDDDRFCHACFSGQYPTPIPNSDDETHEPVPGDPVTAIAD